MNDLVSIIIPVYNVEKYLDKAVQSAADQTYKNIEILLIDDGSKDKSGFLCDEWKKKDDRITVVHKENGGLSSARNAALDICNGDYIYFLDSDDYIDTEAIEIMLADAKETGAQIVEAPFIHVYEDKTVCRTTIEKRLIMNTSEVIKFNLGAYGGVLSPLARSYTKRMYSASTGLLKAG